MLIYSLGAGAHRVDIINICMIVNAPRFRSQIIVPNYIRVPSKALPRSGLVQKYAVLCTLSGYALNLIEADGGSF